MFCKECDGVMKRTYHFEADKSTVSYVCPKCWYETKPKNLYLSSFGEKKEDEEKDRRDEKRYEQKKNYKKDWRFKHAK